MKLRRRVLVSAIVAGLGVGLFAGAGLYGSPAASGGRPATTAEARAIVKAYASSPLGGQPGAACQLPLRRDSRVEARAVVGDRPPGAHPCSGSHLPARLRSACTRGCDSQRSWPMGARRRRKLRSRVRRGTKTRTRRPPSELRTWHRFVGAGTAVSHHSRCPRCTPQRNRIVPSPTVPGTSRSNLVHLPSQRPKLEHDAPTPHASQPRDHLHRGPCERGATCHKRGDSDGPQLRDPQRQIPPWSWTPRCARPDQEHQETGHKLHPQ